MGVKREGGHKGGCAEMGRGVLGGVHWEVGQVERDRHMGRYIEINKREFGVVGIKRQIDIGITAVLQRPG